MRRGSVHRRRHNEFSESATAEVIECSKERRPSGSTKGLLLSENSSGGGTGLGEGEVGIPEETGISSGIEEVGVPRDETWGRERRSDSSEKR